MTRNSVLMLLICLFMGGSLVPAGSILDFSGLGGSEIVMPPSYGDFLPGTPNIDMNYIHVHYTPQTFGVNTGVASGDEAFGHTYEIQFTPDPGFGVTLNQFEISTYDGNTNISALRLLDQNGNVLLDYVSGPFITLQYGLFTPNVSQPGMLRLQFADNWYFGFDNIHFDQFAIPTDGAVPEPSTFGLGIAGLSLLVLSPARRAWRRLCRPSDGTATLGRAPNRA